MTGQETDREMICGLTADERDRLRAGLAGLPQTMPPRIVWERIREQAEAEGLVRRPVSGRPAAWLGAAGLAAAVVLAILVVPRVLVTEPESRTEPLVTDRTNEVPLTALKALMVESRRLEGDLRALPEEPRVLRAGTVATISDIEDRIAAIDYQLNDPALRMTADEKELFWRERVRLMKLLVGLRYAQAQTAAY